VTGAIPLERLGRTLMHEHILVSFDGTQYDPTVSLDRAGLVKEAVHRLGNCGRRTRDTAS
jgi:phosphotriesterase-related protein